MEASTYIYKFDDLSLNYKIESVNPMGLCDTSSCNDYDLFAIPIGIDGVVGIYVFLDSSFYSIQTTNSIGK